MFITLFKHEWKANVKLFSLLSACVLGIGCLAAGVLRLITTYWDTITSQEGLSLLLIPAFLFLFFAYFAVLLYTVALFYIQIFRFYKTRFTDQGYLMFTLPVKTSHIYLSSALHILIWSVISLLVVLFTLAIAVGLGPNWKMLDTYFWAELKNTMSFALSNIMNIGDIIVGIFCILITVAYAIVTPLSAVVLGCVIAKKHKVLAIIGILYGINVVYGIVNSILSFIVTFAQLQSDSYSAIPSMIASAIFPLIMTLVAYPLSIHLMKNKLNLP